MSLHFKQRLNNEVVLTVELGYKIDVSFRIKTENFHIAENSLSTENYICLFY